MYAFRYYCFGNTFYIFENLHNIYVSWYWNCKILVCERMFFTNLLSTITAKNSIECGCNVRRVFVFFRDQNQIIFLSLAKRWLSVYNNFLVNTYRNIQTFLLISVFLNEVAEPIHVGNHQINKLGTSFYILYIIRCLGTFSLWTNTFL